MQNQFPHDPISPSGTALVLGGGGSAGNAWLIGVVAGLHEAGIDLTDADLVIGTSAGSTAAAQLTSGTGPAELLAAILAAEPAASPPPARSGGTAAAADHMARTAAMIAESRDVADLRRRVGSAALERLAASPAGTAARWRSVVAARLPDARWPQRRLLITAVDARTGEPVVLQAGSGIDLVDAVAASCSSSVAYPVGDRAYVDGGYRTNADNADLAAGCARVLVLSPLGGRSRTPLAWGTHLATQVEALRAGGSTVEVVVPDDDAEHLFGANAMDPANRPPAARAGHAQGLALAERLRSWW
ncbi:MAG: patatin-like phospholipase family protein [Frankiales bacterium]|nr:patatin-like phospholipase family protein [Frankiales bacterium]